MLHVYLAVHDIMCVFVNTNYKRYIEASYSRLTFLYFYEFFFFLMLKPFFVCQEFQLSRGLIGSDGCINDYNLKCMWRKQSDLHTWLASFDFFFLNFIQKQCLWHKKCWKEWKKIVVKFVASLQFSNQ